MRAVTATATPADLDAILASIFLTPEGKADPYPGYATVRETVALHQSSFGLKIATRYEDCQALLRDNRLGRGENKIDPALFGLTQEGLDARFPNRSEVSQSMLELDPPDHPRLRALVPKAFPPRPAEPLKPQIRQIIDELLAPLD